MKAYLMIIFTGACLFFSSVSHAETFQGQAIIENGDIDRARFNARQDAMRNCIEKVVGVQVSSSTEVVNYIVVQDRIITNSNGYVKVNKVLKEWQSGNIYCVLLDLTADTKKIETAVEDVKSALQSLSSNSSRYGVQIAVTGRDELGQPKSIMPINQYVQQSLEMTGFEVYVNDAVRIYMNKATDLEDPKVSAEIRRIARENYEGANSILRGTLSTISVTKSGEYVQATVQAAFELIGLENGTVNSFVDYFTAVAATKAEAVKKAEEMAVQRAVKVLGQKALETVQSENRNGVHHIKITAIFNGITDRAGQGAIIAKGLATAKCRIIQQSYASDGSLKIFLETTSYEFTGDLQTAILQQIPGLIIGDNDENAVGSKKLYFSF